MKIQIKNLHYQIRQGLTGLFLIMLLTAISGMAQTPKTAEDYVNQGNEYYDQDKLDLAIASYTKAIKIDLQNADAYYGRGLAYYDQNKIDLAIADFTKAIEINPQDADSFSARGLTYYDQEKFDLAIADFTKAIEIEPEDADAYFGRGLVFYNQDKIELAIADFTKAIQFEPNDSSAYLLRSETYCRNNEWSLARSDEKKVVELGGKIVEECKGTPPQSMPAKLKPKAKVTSDAFKDTSSKSNETRTNSGRRVNSNKGKTIKRIKTVHRSRKRIYKQNRKKRLRRRKPLITSRTSTVSQKTNLPTASQLALPENSTSTPIVNETENSNNTSTRQSGNSTSLKNSIGIEFVNIPAGSFTMGSEDGDSDEKPVHKVVVSQVFQMGKYEVTQAQWKTVMGYNPSSFNDCPQCPVENVSWDEIQEFISKLNATNDGYKYRLPTEAEWEYAARAGISQDQMVDLTSIAWYSDNSGNKTHPVGQKSPNAWGLYDMHGNVSEWVQDWYGNYPSGNVTNPYGPSRGSNRIFRGGAWQDSEKFFSSTSRGSSTPSSRHYDLGFRVIRIKE